MIANLARGCLCLSLGAGGSLALAQESRQSESGAPSSGDAPSFQVDLSGQEVAPAAEPLSEGERPGLQLVVERPWYQNIGLRGYAAATYFDTGDAGGLPDGSLVVRDAALFLDARAWESTSFFLELYLSRFDPKYEDEIETGEVYVRLDDLGGAATDGERSLGLKVGRFDIPFGEEYLWRDAPDNPLITPSASYLYGIDEGVMLFGETGGLNWVGALMEGTTYTSADGDAITAVAGRLYGDVAPDLYLGASAMYVHDTHMSAILVGGQPLNPVGEYGVSTAGVSPSWGIDAMLFELDGTWRAGERTELDLTVGHARLDDEVDAFDRDLTWFRIEPRVRLRPDLVWTLRYSEIGTYDSDEGYRMDGRWVAEGRLLGFDSRRMSRVSTGLGLDLNPKTRLKLELGRDDYELIDGSTLDDGDGDRFFFGLELVVSF